MSALSHHEVTVFLISLSVLLLSARGLGELARHYHQPAVLGEIIAGILLGPTVLGTFAPAFHAFLFPQTGNLTVVLEGLTTLAIVLFLLVAGMEVDLSSIWRQGRQAISIGISGIVFPFLIGFASAYALPQLHSTHEESDPLIFALFFATSLSITALPVIAKILMDLNLYRSDLGIVIIAAAVFNDLIGWLIFAVILGLMGNTSGQSLSIEHTIGLTLCFAGLMLTLGKWALNRALPYVQAHTSWPGGVLGFAVILALLCAAFTEWIGIHAIFGSFLFGIALGESRRFHERTRATLDQFISFIFAPLFFASIGLHVDFSTHFDAPLVATVLVSAQASKKTGTSVRRFSFSPGFPEPASGHRTKPGHPGTGPRCLRRNTPGCRRRQPAGMDKRANHGHRPAARCRGTPRTNPGSAAPGPRRRPLPKRRGF